MDNDVQTNNIEDKNEEIKEQVSEDEVFFIDCIKRRRYPTRKSILESKTSNSQDLNTPKGPPNKKAKISNENNGF